MDWFSGKVSLGNFPDLSDAVNKIRAGVKTIEKNFDNALGLEDNPDGVSSTSEASGSGLWSTDLMSFIGKKDENEDDSESSEKHESSSHRSTSAEHETVVHAKTTSEQDESNVKTLNAEQNLESSNIVSEEVESRGEINIIDGLAQEITEVALKTSNVEKANIGISEEPNVDHPRKLESREHKSTEYVSTSSEDQVTGMAPKSNEGDPPLDLQEGENELQKREETMQEISTIERVDVSADVAGEVTKRSIQVSEDASDVVSNHDSMAELERVKKEMKLMETALLGAARQAQTKADDIANLMNENEQLKSLLEEQRAERKSNEAEVESLREEYHQRVSTLERKFIPSLENEIHYAESKIKKAMLLLC